MTKLGMNAETVSAIATRLDGQAATLNSLISQIDGLVSRAVNVWRGSDAEAFAGWWQNQHKPAMVRAQGSIAGLAQSARNNVAQQQGASATAGTAAAAAGVMGVRHTLDDVNSKMSPIDRLIGLPQDSRNLDHAFLDSGAFRHAAGPVESAMHTGNNMLDMLPKAAVHVSGDVLGKVGWVGTGIAGGTAVVDSVGDFGAHRYDAGIHDVVGGVASGLKSIPTPATYMGGVVVSEYTDVVDAARQIDWSQGLPAPTPSNLIHIYAPSFGEATKEALGDLWGALT